MVEERSCWVGVGRILGERVLGGMGWQLVLDGRPGWVQARKQGWRLVLVERRTSHPPTVRKSLSVTVLALAGLAPLLGKSGRRQDVADSSLAVLVAGGKTEPVVVGMIAVVGMTVVVGMTELGPGTSIHHCLRLIHCLHRFQRSTMIPTIHRKGFHGRLQILRKNVHRHRLRQGSRIYPKHLQLRRRPG